MNARELILRDTLSKHKGENRELIELQQIGSFYGYSVLSTALLSYAASYCLYALRSKANTGRIVYKIGALGVTAATVASFSVMRSYYQQMKEKTGATNLSAINRLALMYGVYKDSK